MKEFNITKMNRRDIANAVELINNAMNHDEGKWAHQTMNFHFNCVEQEMEDGREYYLWWSNDKVSGIVGLHRYIWGPPENVWLAWFAVSPEFQGKGFGRKLLDSVSQKAKSLGYKKLFVETYKHPDFEKAIRFYTKYGFRKAGTIDNYLPDGSEMLVLIKEII